MNCRMGNSVFPQYSATFMTTTPFGICLSIVLIENLQNIYNKFTFLNYYSITLKIKINRSDKTSQKMVKLFKNQHRLCNGCE